MSTTTVTAKQRLVSQIFSVLGKGKQPAPEPRPVLEQFIYAVCREGTTREPADRAFRQLQQRFFDWNEVRVSSTRELAEALAGLPHAEIRAQRIVDFLQEVFETEFSFDLAPLERKGPKLAAKQLARYQAANDYAVAQVVQHSLGGHTIPLDEPSLRALRRLGLLDGDAADLESMRAALEHQVPKARAPLFNDLVSLLADEYCHDDAPRCSACPLCKDCPTGQDLRAATPSTRKPR
ncbi:MAG: endonuclease [Planctomycetes bacterium]|nr:endonuclease [Planctomycetota bacterium]